MKNIECNLHRTATSDEGTFGVFTAPDIDFACICLELPDRANTPMLGRIPAGTYRADWSYSKRFKREMYRLADVPGRVGILIHSANFAGDQKKGWSSELSGCIALGEKIGRLQPNGAHRQKALLSSKHTVLVFENMAAMQHLLITITDEPQPQPPPELCDER